METFVPETDHGFFAHRTGKVLLGITPSVQERALQVQE